MQAQSASCRGRATNSLTVASSAEFTGSSAEITLTGSELFISVTVWMIPKLLKKAIGMPKNISEANDDRK